MKSPTELLRHELFHRFAEGFTQQFLQTSGRVVFFSKMVPPEVRRALFAVSPERCFSMDQTGFSAVSQPLGATFAGHPTFLFAPLSLLRPWLAFVVERGWVHAGLNLKWIALSEPDGVLPLSLPADSPFTVFRLCQVASAPSVLEALFRDHGPLLVELPLPTVYTGVRC